jgi:putative transposase
VRARGKRVERELDDRRLTELIFEEHTTHPAYGVPRVTREQQRQGVPVGRRVVTRLMQQNGISGVTRRRRRNLTKPDKGAAAVPDLIPRQFTAPMPGLVAGNAIMHTVRGSQYHSREYKNALRRLEIRQSTSRTGSCLDGAAAESFFATIRAEIGTESWPDHSAARRDIENWIKHYNERRLHSPLGYRTPIESRFAWQQRMSMAA